MKNQNSKSRTHGFTLMELLIVVAVMGILMAIIVPVYKNSVRNANQASAVSTLNAIKVAQTKYAQDNKEQYASFKQLYDVGLLDKRLMEDPSHHRGYVFTITLTQKSEGRVASYSINANPEQSQGLGATGTHFYYTDPDNGICFSKTGPATAADDNL